jgi:host factor-I protein
LLRRYRDGFPFHGSIAVPGALPAQGALLDCRHGAVRATRGSAATTPRTKDSDVANEKSQNVQDVFLNHVRKQKTPVTVFLVNGVKLQGIITWFDNFSVLLRRDGHTQLVYKHAISTVMPGAPIQLFDASKVEPAQTREPTRETAAAGPQS